MNNGNNTNSVPCCCIDRGAAVDARRSIVFGSIILQCPRCEVTIATIAFPAIEELRELADAGDRDALRLIEAHDARAEAQQDDTSDRVAYAA